MGLFRPIFSMNGPSIEFAVLELLDLPAERATSPGLDDVMGTPFLVDQDGDGVGERVRPTTQVTIRAKATFFKDDQQVQDQAGNDPDSQLQLTLYEEDLLEQGLLTVSGDVVLKAQDRLLKLLNSDGIESPDGTVRRDFTRGGRHAGLRCFEVRETYTGARCFTMVFESQRESESGLAG